jgi:flagellar basal-body rod protein FlgG
MHKGIYIALSGAVLKQRQVDIISQNLANADTLGYKKDILSFKDYLIPRDIVSLEPDGRVMGDLSSSVIDFSSGNFIKTGNPFDVAIEGEGFISLEGGRYTRRGDLKRDSEGYLTTYNGIKVIGKKGPIKLPERKTEISENGVVSCGGSEIDTLRVEHFGEAERLLRKEKDGGIFIASGRGTESNAIFKTGYVEKSNVEVVKEMVRLIESLREFEMFQKAIHFFDEATSKVNNDIGRL